MEFIPLERYSEKSQNKKTVKKIKAEVDNKLEKDETDEKNTDRKIKPKSQSRVLQQKRVKNKYRETLALKKKQRIPRKKIPEEEKKEGTETDNNKCRENNINVGDKEEIHEEQECDEITDEEDSFKKKCQEMDEKKKNRLFIKLKKKIFSEAQIKELHPDIRGVIFPRKKNSRWCWAVFASEERANEAFQQLVKNKDVLVSKPNPYERVHKKLQEKIKTVSRKKELKKKLQNMWM